MTNTDRASDKQLYWIVKLVDEKILDPETYDEIKVAIKRNTITKKDASRFLDILFNSQDIPVAGVVTEEGFYLAADGPTVFKVKKAKTSGKLYAQQVTSKGFAYVPGAIKELRADQKMSVEQICAYGLHTGVCVNCAAELSDPISVHIGLGTKCGPTLMGAEAYSAAKKNAKAALQAKEEALV